MLNKIRLENLSDGMFAIVFTLLVIEIKVPEVEGVLSSAALWHHLIDLQSLFIAYVASLIVLSMFWLSHNFLYSFFVKDINRELVLLNLLYLGGITLIPFTAHLIGQYPETSLALFLYGLNILFIGGVHVGIILYTQHSNEFDTTHVTPRILKQAKIRANLIVGCTLLGLIAAIFYTPLAIILYAFPIIFNIIPGTLNSIERFFGFKIK